MTDRTLVVQYCKELKEEQAGQVLSLLTESNLDFVPPLSARESTTQTELSRPGEGNEAKVPMRYFEEMKKQEFILATEGDRILGFMSFAPDREMCLAGRRFTADYLSTIVVGKAFRRQGIAGRCYACLLRHCKGRNIVTRTWSTNTGHIRLLRELNFSLLETIANDRGNGIDTVYYGRMKNHEE